MHDPDQGPVSQNRDILKGYRFCATLQLRTPLHVLQHHGEVVGLDAVRPAYGPPWSGIWVLETKTYRELGIPIRELPPGPMASEIGPVPADGGDFLVFLKAYRTIVESKREVTERLSKLEELFAAPEHERIVKLLRPYALDWWVANADRH